MLRSLNFGMMALLAATSVGAVAASPTTNGLVRNQTALAYSGRQTPFFRTLGQTCANQAGAGQVRSTCTVAQASNFASAPEEGAVAAAAGGALGFGVYEALKKNKSN